MAARKHGSSGEEEARASISTSASLEPAPAADEVIELPDRPAAMDGDDDAAALASASYVLDLYTYEPRESDRGCRHDLRRRHIHPHS